MKVSELAVKLSLDPQILKEKLRVQGFDAKSVVSQVPDDLAKKMIHEKIASSANQNAVVTYRSVPTKVEGEEGAVVDPAAIKKPKRRFKMMADGSMQLISDESAPAPAPVSEAPATDPAKPELSISQVADQDAIPKSSIDKYTFPVNYGRAKAGTAGTPSGQRQTPSAGGHGAGHNSGQRPRRKKRKYKRDRSEEEEALEALVKPIDQQTEEERNNEIRIATLDSATFMVKDLAAKLNVSLPDLMKEFLKMGALFTVNQEIDIETATKVAQRFGIMIELDQKSAAVGKAEKKMIEKLEETNQDASKLKNRPPVITIMGHVDHGKTRLLDTIRTSRVAEGEAGGITQHIGAYQVKVKNRLLTFLDTPGHAAFTQLRARGAQVTDVVVLVVAADDGVMPQTLEAIDHARAAKVPIVVAINKIDKPEANIERSKQMLTEHGLVPEEWGGDTVMVPISAKANKNIDELLDLIITVADLKELKANYDTQAQGVIIEAKLSAQRGSVATVLVQRGTLKVGDSFVIGTTSGKVRAMFNDQGKKVEQAEPSCPVEIIGIDEVPHAGDILQVVADERTARQVAGERLVLEKNDQTRRSRQLSLETLSDGVREGAVHDLNLIVKGDVRGSVEAINASLLKLTTPEVKINIIHSGTGAISESDIMLAKASSGVILAFSTDVPSDMRRMADDEGIAIREYNIIYNLLDDIEKAMEGLLEPEALEVLTGKAEVKSIFKSSKAGNIAGCLVIEGSIKRNSKVKVYRGKKVIAEDKIETLKRFKDEAKEVQTSQECGIGFEKFNDIAEGDIIEAFEIQMKNRTLTKAAPKTEKA